MEAGNPKVSLVPTSDPREAEDQSGYGEPHRQTPGGRDEVRGCVQVARTDHFATPLHEISFEEFRAEWLKRDLRLKDDVPQFEKELPLDTDSSDTSSDSGDEWTIPYGTSLYG